MNELINGIDETLNCTTTENGADAYASTRNACLDAFGSLGAMRASSDSNILSTFWKAFDENQVTAMRLLFYVRDMRGGQGERRVFRVILRDLAEKKPQYVVMNLGNILNFGRGDDFLCLLDTEIGMDVAKFLKEQLAKDIRGMVHGESASLLAKWLPSENASSEETRRIARQLCEMWHVAPKNYRKNLTALRSYLKVVEQKMSANEWKSIEYSAVPAKAGTIYGNAFYAHDEERYDKYLDDVAEGKVKVNAQTLYPYEVVSKAMDVHSRIEAKKYNVLWNNLPNYFEGTEESALCMVDTSGSMCGLPYHVAVSLGLYCVDKCKGPFNGYFITFSEKPQLVKLQGENFVEKVNRIECINAGNTDIEAAFDLILDTAIRTGCSQEDLPKKLYILSDMQFDEARSPGWGYYKKSAPRPSFMQQMKQKFSDAGYTMPALVYWNLRASNCGMFQETFEGENCCMVSGFSASLFDAVIKGTQYVVEEHVDGGQSLKQVIDPMEVMRTTLYSERYDCVMPNDDSH